MSLSHLRDLANPEIGARNTENSDELGAFTEAQGV